MQTCCQFFCSSNSISERALINALAAAGISALSSDRGEQKPIILFFDKFDDGLCERVQELSDSGTERVFAIASSEVALTNADTWTLLHAGASEVFVWNHSADPAAEIACRIERWAAVDELLESPVVQTTLVGQSPVWKKMLRRIVELAHFTNTTILILGESGTGKELVARLIHTLDSRIKKSEFVVLDCATIVPELSGSEFFGHERGAFTSAVHSRDGAFSLADKGTLFLDEIGELPLPLQAQLLRAIQERTYKRVGGNTWYSADFRLVCATNRDLFEGVKLGEFRHDLYYRIATWIVRLPPLRDRRSDILPLARHFLRQLRPEAEPLDFDHSVREYLITREYPGNVRELWQVIARIVDRHVGPGSITVGDIPEDDRPVNGESGTWLDESFEQAIRQALSSGAKLKEIGRATEETAVRIAVDDEQGNLQRAAARLGVTDRALQMRRASARRSSL
ncbi:Sigma-54 interaction domain-containing protein [Nitrosospira briensis]|uniref:Sigma-54 interaction domain-containing protein n=1 Tax=Nitrosospira briensis TaxID=35799 RepID=A0A1I5DGS3_9PROT|nr:sigma 54-interacting transcriptional regulator [Nitrosospira briensis]SFN98366.1 Sigma-54 interaction domain-containing protein [Nitrosospira briensis]